MHCLSIRLHITFFCKYEILGSGNSGCCSLSVKVKSGNSQGVLIHVLGMTGQVSIIALLSGA